jgi:putative membrane protein
MRSSRWIQTAICTGLLMCGAAAFAQRAPQQTEVPDRTTASDQRFLVRALRMNELLLRIGRLAREAGNAPDIRARGESMVQKYTDLGRQLSDQARRANINPTAQLTPEQAAVVTRLVRLSGPEFDTQFAATVDMLEQQELAMYKYEATRASDPELRALTQSRIGPLQEAVNEQPPQLRPD